jgi:anti-anti-sigma factor
MHSSSTQCSRPRPSSAANPNGADDGWRGLARLTREYASGFRAEGVFLVRAERMSLGEALAPDRVTSSRRGSSGPPSWRRQRQNGTVNDLLLTEGKQRQHQTMGEQATANSGVPAGSITMSREADDVVLRLSGEIDAAVVRRFELQEGRRLWSTASGCIIDAAEVSFIDVPALRLLLRCQSHAARYGRATVLRGSTGCLDRLLDLTGTNRFFLRDPAMLDTVPT